MDLVESGTKVDVKVIRIFLKGERISISDFGPPYWSLHITTANPSTEVPSP